jgi:V8-like Glu-specific endopeptidase
MLELTGPQKKKLREALIAAFPSWSALSKLTSDELDLNLAEITGDSQGIDTNAFDLVTWAASRGTLATLIVAARNVRPANAKIQAIAAAVELTAVPVIGDLPLSAPAFEKFVSDNVILLDVEKWRVGQTHAEWRVCRIDSGNDAAGTGFLVGPDLVLTNYHVVQSLIAPELADAAGWIARFDHKIGADGKTLAVGRAVKFAADWCVDHAPFSTIDTQPDPKSGDPSNDELDFALIRLAEPIGDEPISPKSEEQRGWVALKDLKIVATKKQMIAILQHPRGGPMKLAMGMAEKLTLNAAGNRVRHGVPTEPGSSGSPMFDQDWTLIALHHSGDPKEIKPEYNEAIPISLIASRPKVVAALPQ